MVLGTEFTVGLSEVSLVRAQVLAHLKLGYSMLGPGFNYYATRARGERDWTVENCL